MCIFIIVTGIASVDIVQSGYSFVKMFILLLV